MRFFVLKTIQMCDSVLFEIFLVSNLPTFYVNNGVSTLVNKKKKTLTTHRKRPHLTLTYSPTDSESDDPVHSERRCAKFITEFRMLHLVGVKTSVAKLATFVADNFD